MKYFLAGLLPASLLLALCAAAAAAGPSPVVQTVPLPPSLSTQNVTKLETNGSYRDSSGKVHPWFITNGHVLEWDNTPYLPVGGAFMPHYWVEGQDAAQWAADVHALEILKQHKIYDLYLDAGSVGLTYVPVAAVQRLLDYLDANGFRYGLKLADFARDPLIGYVVKPSVYRDPAPPFQGISRFSHISGLADALYLVVSKQDLQITESGSVRVTGGTTAEVNVQNGGPDSVLLLYPQRMFLPGSEEGHLPNLWQGYDEYRDRLLAFFSRVHLGHGFRFFLDPLTDEIGFRGDAENLVPTTDEFRLEYQTWLDRKYKHNVDDINTAWGISQRNLADFTTAARCLPLWSGTRGVPDMYDPDKKFFYEVRNKPNIVNRAWEDLNDFRLESTRSYMNMAAAFLKKNVADVPVVYRWTRPSPLFTNDQERVGYDGLGVDVYGHGHQLSVDTSVYAYAQAEESPKTTWLIVSGTQDTANPVEKQTPGYASKTVLFNDWDALQDVGMRGYFADSLQRLPESQYKNFNLAAQPDQLGWLSSYAATLEADARSLSMTEPSILWYPALNHELELSAKRLHNGFWWLPAYRKGNVFSLGPSLRGYSFPDSSGYAPSQVLWSPRGTFTTAQFLFDQKIKPVVTDTTGLILKAPNKNGKWTLPVSAEPIIIGRVGSIPLPMEVVDAVQQQVKDLLRLAELRHLSTLAQFKDRYFYAINNLPTEADAIQVRYDLLQQLVVELTEQLRAYAWVEGENAAVSNFTALVPDAEASGGAYLSLDTDRDPASDAEAGGFYHVEYKFAVNAPGSYEIWISGTPLSGEGSAVSPFTYRLDKGQANTAQRAVTGGGLYAGKFEWSHVGDATLTTGPHRITIEVTGRRPSDHMYHLDIDALCISRVPFLPNGTEHPPIDTTLPPPAANDKADKNKNAAE